MRHILIKTVLVSAMALSLSLPAAIAAQSGGAKPQKQPSPHALAVKACNDTYKAALKEAKTKKGKERQDAVAAAKTAHKDCLKNAPK